MSNTERKLRLQDQQLIDSFKKGIYNLPEFQRELRAGSENAIYWEFHRPVQDISYKIWVAGNIGSEETLDMATMVVGAAWSEFEGGRKLNRWEQVRLPGGNEGQIKHSGYGDPEEGTEEAARRTRTLAGRLEIPLESKISFEIC
jgi:hypothetical protein